MHARIIGAVAALVLTGSALAEGLALRVDGLFHGVGKPITAALDDAAPDQRYDLLLLDANGAQRASATVTGGATFDLREMLPALDTIATAHWLQLAKDGAPIGTPWVAQPLVSRPLIRTTSALRPDGKTPYTRVIGWGDRLLEPDNADYVKLKESWPKGDPTPLSGWRIYADRDVVLTTDKGVIKVALAPEFAPNTAWNFRSLVEGGLYDGTPFHRVVKFDRQGRPFVIQGGDPTGSGDGAAGYDLPLEPSELPHDFGVISIARNDAPDSAGSQYFFCLSREGTARLDWQYCAFGWAIEGADVIVTIADSEIADQATGKPKAPAMVTKAELVPAPARIVGQGRPQKRVEVPSAAARPSH